MLSEILIQTLACARSVAVLTGAGISAESGVPTFRDPDGLWKQFKPQELASMDAFLRTPDLVWEWYSMRRKVLDRVQPNPGHFALVEMELLFPDFTLITQNVDGLHQIAGNSNVIEYHGNHRWLICTDCSKRIPLAPEHVSLMPYPSCDRCGTPLKPDVVFFGEGIPMRAVVQANDEAMRCKVLVIIGTSGVVYPAAEIPYASKANGAVVVEINVSPTPFTTSITDHYLEGSASEILPQITGRL